VDGYLYLDYQVHHLVISLDITNLGSGHTELLPVAVGLNDLCLRRVILDGMGIDEIVENVFTTGRE
jgi:hypothetical protein